MSDPPHSPGAPSEPASLILRMHTAGPDERIAILHDLLIRKATVCYTPDDLDRITGLLDHEPRVVELALQILGNAALKKGMLPADRSRFREKLRYVLQRFRSDGSQRAIIRSAVHLLGYLCDPAVLEQLAYDAERF
ncbi:MAG: hypothetical protein GKC04_07610 [Methanomicrobiales archaeon]|nr:hypothetical protein [Methanomicrobiales archaeon]